MWVVVVVVAGSTVHPLQALCSSTINHPMYVKVETHIRAKISCF
jgi:hypothetical protein